MPAFGDSAAAGSRRPAQPGAASIRVQPLLEEDAGAPVEEPDAGASPEASQVVVVVVARPQRMLFEVVDVEPVHEVLFVVLVEDVFGVGTVVPSPPETAIH